MSIDVRNPQGAHTKFRVVRWVPKITYSANCSPEYRAVTLASYKTRAAAERFAEKVRAADAARADNAAE